MLEDRKEQETLLKTFQKMVGSMKVIRRKQDDYWNDIQRVLASPEHYNDLENSSEASRLQAWPHAGAQEDVPSEVDSDAEVDSVLGYSTQHNDGSSKVREMHQQSALNAQTPVRTKSTSAIRTRIDTQARESTELNADYILDLAADESDQDVSGIDTDYEDAHEAVEVIPLSQTHQSTAGRETPQSGLGTTKRTVPIGTIANAEGASSGSVYEPSTPLKADLAVRSTMKPPPSRTPTSKSKRRRTAENDAPGERPIENYFIPTRSSEPRPKRSAKTSAEKRNRIYYDFSRMSARAQSQVFSDESGNPFHNCYDCKKATCQKCSHKWMLEDNNVGLSAKKRRTDGQ
jgi:hypothetical protein